MHAKPDLRVFLKWMVAGSGSVITDVIRLRQILLEVPKRKIERLSRMLRNQQVDWRYVHDWHLINWLNQECDPVELLNALPETFIDELREWALCLPDTDADKNSRVSLGNSPDLSLDRCILIKNWFLANHESRP